MNDDKITWSERWENIKQVWGFSERPPTVETIPNSNVMLPTASGNDDGAGWVEVYDEASGTTNWQREVIIGSCPGEGWTEGSPGVWHESKE